MRSGVEARTRYVVITIIAAGYTEGRWASPEWNRLTLRE
jgi:hypothetical protein